ncbi:MAG TPA: anti-sigma factor [Candidatus Baltobacteraceae bacterium]|nr:anti-sigma factor [Candidatus Baltobacteraceae bacterium]
MNERADRESMLELVALYALGVLPDARADGAECAEQVRAFIASDAEARREYDDLRAAADAIALTAEEPVDSRRALRMRERLLARVRADAATPVTPFRARRPAVFPAVMWGSALVAAAAILFSVITVSQDVALRGQLAAAQRRASSLQTQLGQSERVGSQDRRMLTDLLSPEAKRYDVAQGTVVVHGDRVYLVLAKLAAPPRGHVYQAWTATKGSSAMAPSVTFAPNAEGVAIVALPVDAAKVGTVAVSVEPDGGSKAPTTTPTFVRPLS